MFRYTASADYLINFSNDDSPWGLFLGGGYDNHSREKVFYGYSLPANVSKDIDFGKPYFNRQGEFLGIYSKVVQIHNPILIKKEIIQDFICGLKKKNIVTKNPLANSCKAKGV
ncbi:hypothetical protein [Helicobacter sp. 13S00477-4]|uniref:hypothetical protein n=1 Tax=Helicobacter sp. 13S00477-4 TaxID=1905759 RepID=UPI000BA7228F|nr:hypothetical protein [Helicobacter sp. 13S00477-4]PAF50490.1 hypothetical protein BKH44_08015 [Helicobacter sp. 13S00477-4]